MKSGWLSEAQVEALERSETIFYETNPRTGEGHEVTPDEYRRMLESESEHLTHDSRYVESYKRRFNQLNQDEQAEVHTREYLALEKKRAHQWNVANPGYFRKGGRNIANLAKRVLGRLTNPTQQPNDLSPGMQDNLGPDGTGRTTNRPMPPQGGPTGPQTAANTMEMPIDSPARRIGRMHPTPRGDNPVDVPRNPRPRGF